MVELLIDMACAASRVVAGVLWKIPAERGDLMSRDMTSELLAATL